MSFTEVAKSIRILLVEDNPHDRRVFHRAFRKSDIPTEITDCKRAEAALDLLVADVDQYDLVVSDHGLPGSSGLDLYRQLKERQIELPFVLLTGVGNELLAVEALKLGIHDYLPKNAGQAYVEQLPPAITRVYQAHRDRVQKAQIEAELEQWESKEQFLSEATATALLSAMDDYHTTAAKLAQLPVPFFADWSLVELLNQNGTARHTAAAHVNPDQQTRIDRLSQARANAHSPGRIATEVMRLREPQLITDITDPQELFGVGAAKIVEALHPQSLICAPLVVRDRVIGVLWLVYSEGRSYKQKDVAFAVRIAQRDAIAIENARVYAAVRETDRRKDEFLAMLAHELRNPLAPVRNGLEILRGEHVDPALAQKVITTMERQVKHMMRLVDDLLDLSRVMRGKITLHRQRVAFESILQRALELAQPLIEARRHELILQVPEEDVWLEVDEARITQVLANLLNNAAKYTDEGGHIWLRGDVENEKLLIRVRDDGIGIEPHMLTHIFDLFQQVESSMDRSHGGLGIGLTLVRSLTEMHDGVLSAHSDGLGQGSEFQVQLPLAQPTRRSETVLTGNTQPCGTTTSGVRILVIDDNVDAADMLSALLRLEGHHVSTANEGRIGLEMADNFHPDVILLDIGMPGMNGYEVAKLLRGREEFRETLLIAITGFGQEVDRRSTRDAGFDLHLVKPVAPQAIRDALAQYFESDPASRTTVNPSSN